MVFTLDHRLEDSSFFVEDWELCRVSLKNDKTWPWLYLVPRRENIREMHDLSTADQALLIREISVASRALEMLCQPTKINIAALGNMVPQLHVHVFARFKDDLAWPRPVWAVQWEEIPYTDSLKNAEVDKIRKILSKIREG